MVIEERNVELEHRISDLEESLARLIDKILPKVEALNADQKQTLKMLGEQTKELLRLSCALSSKNN